MILLCVAHVKAVAPAASRLLSDDEDGQHADHPAQKADVVLEGSDHLDADGVLEGSEQLDADE
jgi:hypothetical protein